MFFFSKFINNNNYIYVCIRCSLFFAILSITITIYIQSLLSVSFTLLFFCDLLHMLYACTHFQFPHGIYMFLTVRNVYFFWKKKLEPAQSIFFSERYFSIGIALRPENQYRSLSFTLIFQFFGIHEDNL